MGYVAWEKAAPFRLKWCEGKMTPERARGGGFSTRLSMVASSRVFLRLESIATQNRELSRKHHKG